MNDSIQLSGLSRQLVQANLLDEKTAVQAQAQAQRNKLSLVTHLVQSKLVSGSGPGRIVRRAVRHRLLRPE